MKRFIFSYGGKTVWKTSIEVKDAAAQDLKDMDYINRRFAVGAMHELHRQAGNAAQVDSVVPELVELLEDDDTGVRYWSMATLAALGSEHIFNYCEPMAAALKDADAGVRTYAAIGLAAVGAECDSAFEFIPNLQEAIEDSDPQVRIEATKALVEMIEAEDLVDIAQSHLTALQDRRLPIFRASAAEAIGYLGEGGLPHVEHLANALNDQYPRVREAAAKALGNLGRSEGCFKAMQETCVPLANLAQSDPVIYVQSAAAHALMQMDLSEALHHEESSYRAWAAKMIANKGPRTITPLVTRLGELLKDEDPQVRYWSAWALGDGGDPALEHLPTLQEGSRADADAEARVSATKACVKLDQAAAKGLGPDITPSLKHEDAAFRKSAAQCLGALGQDAVAEAYGLNEALLDEDPAVRLAAVLAIKNGGKQAVRTCGENLGECSRTDEDSDVAKWSAVTLHEFGLAARFGAPCRKGL